ncbi:MAG: DUF4367 domain-containing protein [Lachnospiraceae bacterium]|jgi:hypothetical protein
MRLDELRNELPEVPDLVHTRILDEVDKQLQENQRVSIFENKKRSWNLSRMAAAAAACVLAVSTVAYAGTRFYHMYLEQQGKYSVATGIEGNEESETIQLPKEVHDLEIKAGYIPDGMEWNDEYKLSYADTPYQGGISISSVLMDKNDLGAAMVDTGVIESEERNFGNYEGVYLRYLDLNEDTSFNQRIYMLCPEEYRVFTIYVGDDVSKEDAVKFAENLVITEKEEMLETEGLYTWSDLVNPEEAGEDSADVTAVADTKLPVHQIGDTVTLKASGEDKDGNFITDGKITAKVDSVQITDDLKLMEGKEIPEEWKAAVGSDGRLVKNNLSYVKSGDGVETLDQVVKEESVNQKLVYAKVTYTNDTDEEINHMLYMGSIMLMKHEDGKYQVYNAEEESGDGYDYVIGDGAAHAGEMTYCSVKEDYGNGGNYITSLKPGESMEVEMAWIVNENNLKDMYLNLNGYGGTYSIEDSDLETGVVYIGE